MDGVQDALPRRVEQGRHAALDLLILQARIAKDFFHVGRFKAVLLARQTQLRARLGPMPAMELPATLLPGGEQARAFRIVIDENGNESSGIRLGRVEAVFLDVLDDARRLVAAKA